MSLTSDKEKNKQLGGGSTILGSSNNNKVVDGDDDDYENDPWDMDDHKRGSASGDKKGPAVKSNPFDQKVKPAFEDLEGIDVGKKKPAEPKKQEPEI